MAKTLVLLDVDETLWFHSSTEPFNYELINRLLQLEAIDIFLFTDMTLNSEHVQHRLDLIRKMEELGLRVHGVITPSDILWDKELLSMDVLNESREYLSAAFLNNKPGAAFATASNELKEQGFVSKVTIDKSHFISRKVMPYFTNIFEYRHLKGLLFEFFLKHVSNEIEKIIVVDDRLSILKSIRKACKSQKSFLESNNLTIDTIHIVKKHSGIYYSMEAGQKAAQLNTSINGFEGSEFFQRRDVINVMREIYRLRNASAIFFIESRQIKATRIENALLKALKHGCEDVTQDVQVRNELEHHRICNFWGLKKANSILNVDRIPVSTPKCS